MNSEQTTAHAGGKRGLWILCLVICLLGGLAFYIVFLITGNRNKTQQERARIEQRIQALRASGQPVTALDLLRMFPDPSQDHNASRILEPSAMFLIIPDDPTNVPFLSDTPLPHAGDLPAGVRSAISILARKNRATLDAILWEKLGAAWVGSGLAGGFTNVSNSRLSSMTRLMKLLCLNALLFAEDQNPHEAAEYLLKDLAVGHTLKNDLPIHHLGNALSQILASQSLERILNRTTIGTDDLRALSGALTLTNLTAVKQQVIFERCFGLYVASELGSLTSQMTTGLTDPVRRLTRDYQSRIFYQDDDLLRYLDWNQECLAALDLPASNAVSRLRTIEADNAKRKHVSFLDGFSRRGPSVLSILEPQVSQFLLREANAVAHVRLALAALAIEEWREHHPEQFPSRLADLVPTYLPMVPTDPFDDHPLRYTRLANGYVLYSVGPNFVDDGGKTASASTHESSQGDITFSVGKVGLRHECSFP